MSDEKVESSGIKLKKLAKECENKVLIYFNERNRYPVLIGEKTKPEDNNLTFYLTRYGAESAKRITSRAIKREKEIRKNRIGK